MAPRSRTSASGFTMVELLIVMLIGAILTTSIIAVFVHQTRAMALQEDLVDLEENLRAALSILHRDVRTAGLGLIAQNQSFFIGNLDLNADGVADNVYTNNPLASDHANQVFKPDAMRVKYAHPEEDGILISSYNGAASQMQVCGPSGLNDGDVFLVMTPSSPPKIRALEVTSFNTNCTDAACPNSDCDKIVFAPGPSELNTAGGAGAAYVGGKVVLTTNIYYLGNDAGGNPAMFRVSNYQLPHAIIAFGVVDFQVEYGVPFTDPVTGNKTINYTSAPPLVQDVAMVKISLTGRTRNTHRISSAPGQRPQRTLSTEIQVRNLFY